MSNDAAHDNYERQVELFRARGVPDIGVPPSALVAPAVLSDAFGYNFDAGLVDFIRPSTSVLDVYSDAAYHGSKLAMVTPKGGSRPVRIAVPTTEAAFVIEVGIIEELTVKDDPAVPPMLMRGILSDVTGSAAQNSQFRARILCTKNKAQIPDISDLKNIPYRMEVGNR